MQDEKEAAGLLNADADSGAGLFMEWAVNKQGELMRANTGKLMLPGSKIRWDIHYSAGGEDITDDVELGIYFYPKGQEPKYRTALSLYSGVTGGNRNLDIAPNSISVGQNFHVMRKAGRVENFQPHMHLRGKAMMVEAILPNGTAAGARLRAELRVQLDEQLRLRRRLRAAAAQGHDPQDHRVARQHARQEEQPRPDAVDRLGRPHGRRDGARVDQHHLHERRRLQQGSRSAQGKAGRHHRAAAAVRPLAFFTEGVPRNGTPSLFTQEFFEMTSRLMGRTALASWPPRCLAAGAHVAATRQLAMEPLKDAGQNVYPAFEGWYQNDDG